jgi:hypothetical protein
MTRQNSRPPKKKRRRHSPTKGPKKQREKQQVKATVMSSFTPTAALFGGPSKKRRNSSTPNRNEYFQFQADGRCNLFADHKPVPYGVKIIREDAAMAAVEHLHPGDHITLTGYFPKQIRGIDQQFFATDFSLSIDGVDYPQGRVLPENLTTDGLSTERANGCSPTSRTSQNFVVFQETSDVAATSTTPYRVLLSVTLA